MKNIQKNWRVSFNIFFNSAKQLEVPLKHSITQGLGISQPSYINPPQSPQFTDAFEKYPS